MRKILSESSHTAQLSLSFSGHLCWSGVLVAECFSSGLAQEFLNGYGSVVLQPKTNIALLNTMMAMPMMQRGLLPVPDHSPVTAPQKLALNIPIDERIGHP